MAQINTTLPANNSSYAILNRIQTDESETDFDRAGMDILFRGTEKELRAAFPKGSASNFPTSGSPQQSGVMICAGVKITQNRFGFLWARVEWVGLLTLPGALDVTFANTASATAVVRGVTTLINTKEMHLPVTPDGGSQIDADAPYNGAGGLVRARTTLIFHEVGRDYQILLIVPRDRDIGLPKITAQSARPSGLTDVFNNATSGPAIDLSGANWFAGIGAQGGWLCRDFQAASVLILGDTLLCRASAKFQWVDRFTPN